MSAHTNPHLTQRLHEWMVYYEKAIPQKNTTVRNQY